MDGLLLYIAILSATFCTLLKIEAVSSQDITGYVAVDHKGSLTADPGAQILVSQFSNWKNAEYFTLPANTRYVTIKGERKQNAIGGILAKFSNGFVTDSSWHCTEINSTTKGDWPAATEIASNNGTHSQWNRVVTEISQNAKWIWTTNSGDDEVWCRKSIGGITPSSTTPIPTAVSTSTVDQSTTSFTMSSSSSITINPSSFAETSVTSVDQPITSFTTSSSRSITINPSPSSEISVTSVEPATSSTTSSSTSIIINPSIPGIPDMSTNIVVQPTSTASNIPSTSTGPLLQPSDSLSTLATTSVASSPNFLSSSTPTLNCTVTTIARTGLTTKSVSSMVHPTSTGPVISPSSTKTAATKAKEDLKAIDVKEKDAFEKIVNVTENFLNSERTNSSSANVEPAVEIAQTVEEKVMEYAKANLGERHNGTYNKKTEDLEIQIKFVPPKGLGYLTFPTEAEQITAKEEPGTKSVNFITIPVNGSSSNSSIFVGILYNTTAIGSSVNIVFERKTNESNKSKLISTIISAAINPKPKFTEDLGNVTFTLSHGKGYDKVYCAFLDESKSPTFSTRGCSVVSHDETRTKCTCNHLTSFAIVAKIDPKNSGDSSHRKALSIITYIGMTLSLIGEILTVGCYVLLIGLSTEQAHLHTNLALSLALAQICFLAGMSVASNEAACLVVTSMIHYFYLVTFCWMLVEGFHLYLMVVKVFNENSYLKFYYLFSWITPLVIVGLALIAAAASSTGISGYVSIEACWIAHENNFIWFFLGPVLVICLANLVLLILVVREMTKMNKTKAGGPSLQFRKSVKACLLLFPILGTAWIFAVLLMLKYSLAVEYIFNILNSIQGFMIFLFYVMRSSEIRGVVQQRKARWATTMDLTNHASTYNKTTTHKTQTTSASSIKPILGNWVPTKSRYSPSLGSTRSSQCTPSPRESPRSTPTPRESPRDSRHSQFNTPSRLTTADPLDLFENPRRPSSANKIYPDLEIYDAETSA